MVGKKFICQQPYSVYVFGNRREIKKGYKLEILGIITNGYTVFIEELRAKGTISKYDVPSDTWKPLENNNIRKIT